MASTFHLVGLGFNGQPQSSHTDVNHQTRGPIALRQCRDRLRDQHRTAFNLRRQQLCRRRYSSVTILAKNIATSDDDSVLLGYRPGGASRNGASPKNVSSFNSKQADITELAFVRESEVRSKLVRKLSEANQYVRHLQHELQEKEDSLMNTRSELAAIEMELQVLVKIAQEVSRQGIKPGTRKINGRYIQSHLASRLEELQKVLFARIKDVDEVRTRKVELVFFGMAEDVQVMGSFDGWARGEQMSPESSGTFTKFTATIELRPGKYSVYFNGQLCSMYLVYLGPAAIVSSCRLYSLCSCSSMWKLYLDQHNDARKSMTNVLIQGGVTISLMMPFTTPTLSKIEGEVFSETQVQKVS